MDDSMTISELRDNLGTRIKAAYFGGEPTVVTNARSGEPQARLVPISWRCSGPVRAGEENWQPGDVVLAADAAIWTRATARSIGCGWPWRLGARGPAGVIPDGRQAEDEPVRPLTLLVRDGKAVR
jgi:antitoxin (DNA-binding transcriptional repressor) of toxin-antitoxin stability system